MQASRAFAIIAAIVAGCGPPATSPPASPTSDGTAEKEPGPDAGLPPSTKPPGGGPAAREEIFVVHVVDVGTGLGMFVEGPNFTLVCDAGSGDDKADGERNRFLAYLRATKPDLKNIDHVVISHPHDDHVSLMPDLFSTYSVKSVWDSGAKTGLCSYQKVISWVAEKKADYHSATKGSGDYDIEFTKQCSGMPPKFTVRHGDQIVTGLEVDLGANASMTFLHANGKTDREPNNNTLVVRLDLGSSRVLLMVDAGAGKRDDPSATPVAGSIEAVLLDSQRDQIDADVLVVGHHGSKTSSREAFLEAVTPVMSIISSGPKNFSGVTLPDQEVVDALEQFGDVFRTDADDYACRRNPAKIGTDDDGKPGGCDNVRVSITGYRSPDVGYWRGSD